MDFKITPEGDLLLDTNKNLAIVKKDELKLQIARNCVKSVQSDWYMDNIGANLERFIGLPCSTATVEAIKKQIISSLVSQDIYETDHIYIEDLELSKHKIVLRVYLKNSQEKADCLDVTVDTINGVHIKKG